jgi:hypothetical protein
MTINTRFAVSLLAAGIVLAGSVGSRTLAALPDAPAQKGNDAKDEKPAVETHPVVSIETPRGMIRFVCIRKRLPRPSPILSSWRTKASMTAFVSTVWNPAL